jgi:hypothetical protein
MVWNRPGAGQYPSDFTFDQVAKGQPIPGMGGGPGAPAGAEPMVGARGIYVMPAQLGVNSFGLYLLDLDAGNIVVYKALPDSNRFHLMAARNFRNDRFLEDFNNDSPTPKEVQKLIQQQRQRQDLGGETPAAAPTPAVPPTFIPAVPPG